MFLGTISPNATCADTTSSSAITSDTGCSHASGTPRAWNTGSSRAATAGSPSAPSSTPHRVMPSCAQAIISDTCSIALSVERARALFTASGSMTVRRAAISANSAATKNALAASSTTTSPSSSHSVVIGRSPRRSPIVALIAVVTGVQADRGQQHGLDPAAGQPVHGQPHGHRARQVVLGLRRDRRVVGVQHLARPARPGAPRRPWSRPPRPSRSSLGIRPSRAITSPATVS